MNLKINFPNLIRQLLPNHKRKSNILWLLRALVFPLADLYVQFDEWRDNIRIEMNMTCQVGVLEGYLRAKYNDDRIRVQSASDRGLPFAMPFEGRENAVQIGLGTTGIEKETSVQVPLPGEIRSHFEDADFVISIPSGYDHTTIERIRIDIERYKQVLINYNIIER